MSNKVIFSNIFHAFLTKGINFLVPLLFMPFIIRIYGVNKFGDYFYAQSLLQTYALFIDFGFVITAVKAVANNLENTHERNKISSFVISFKLILSLISIIFFFLYFLITGLKQSNLYLFFFVFTSFCFQINLPIWFFQGIQKNGLFSIINLISKLFLLAIVFFTIKSTSPLYLIPLYETIAYIIALLFSAFFMYYFQNFYFVKFTFSENRKLLFESFQIFLISILNWVIVSGSAIVLKSRVTSNEFGIFSAYSRLSYYVFAIVQPLNQALLPYFSRLFSTDVKEAYKKFKLFLWGIIAISICVLAIAYFAIDKVNSFLFGSSHIYENFNYKLLFCNLLIWVGLVLINSFINSQFLVTQNKVLLYKKYYLINTVLAIALSYILSISMGSLGIALALIFGEFIMMILLINQLNRANNLMKSNV